MSPPYGATACARIFFLNWIYADFRVLALAVVTRLPRLLSVWLRLPAISTPSPLPPGLGVGPLPTHRYPSLTCLSRRFPASMTSKTSMVPLPPHTLLPAACPQHPFNLGTFPLARPRRQSCHYASPYNFRCCALIRSCCGTQPYLFH
jgi:hypothetical protein